MEVLYSDNITELRKNGDIIVYAHGICADIDLFAKVDTNEEGSNVVIYTKEFIFIKTDDGIEISIEYDLANKTEKNTMTFNYSGLIGITSITTNTKLKNENRIVKLIVKLIKKVVGHDSADNYEHNDGYGRGDDIDEIQIEYCQKFKFPYKSPKKNNIKYLRLTEN